MPGTVGVAAAPLGRTRRSHRSGLAPARNVDLTLADRARRTLEACQDAIDDDYAEAERLVDELWRARGARCLHRRS